MQRIETEVPKLVAGYTELFGPQQPDSRYERITDFTVLNRWCWRDKEDNHTTAARVPSFCLPAYTLLGMEKCGTTGGNLIVCN